MRRSPRPRLLAPALLLAMAGCLPELGAVDGHVFAAGVQIDDPRIGASVSPPVVVRIEVDENGKPEPAGVGALVKRKFFADRQPFLFNVMFACGRPEPGGAGSYTDPRSIWFNVFVGYYEIDVSKALWKRPFAYDLDGKQVEMDDMIRLGKADWNYFSNYVYGVPEGAITPHDALAPARGRSLGKERIGHRMWDLIEIEGAEMVSAYVSGQDGQRLADPGALSTQLWRDVLGRENPRPEFPTSFIPTRMHARIYLSYAEGIDPHSHERTYRTTIFGGTINDTYPDARENQRFLDVQLAAIRRVIEASYPDLGFSAGRASKP